MRRWLALSLVVAVLLLLGCLAGDVFFLHRHLDSIAIEEHFVPAFAARFIENPLFLSQMDAAYLLSGRCSQSPCDAGGSVAQYFCGWNSSAYKWLNSVYAGAILI